jgi:hypothetical protein
MNYLFGDSGVAATKGRRLRVCVGPSPATLSVHPVNRAATPHYIDSPWFCGHVAVRVKGFAGVLPDGDGAAGAPAASGGGDDAAAVVGPSDELYFEGKKRLFSIQVSGRFKQVGRLLPYEEREGDAGLWMSRSSRLGRTPPARPWPDARTQTHRSRSTRRRMLSLAPSSRRR